MDPAIRRAARAELRAERAWLPALGEWNFRVSRFFFLIGLAVATAAMVAALIGYDARPPLAAVFVVPALVAGVGWAIARWLGPGTYPVTHVANGLLTAIVWFVIGAAARALLLRVFPNALALGSVERWFLGPPLFGLVMVLGARMRLNGYVTFIAAVVLSLGFIANSDDGTTSDALSVSQASVLQLGRAQQSGRVILLRSSGEAPRRSVEALQAARRSLVAAAATCATVDGLDARRTLIGFPGRAIAFLGKVCWDAGGKPVQAEFDTQASRRRGGGTLLAIRPGNLGAFDAATHIIDSRISAGDGYGYDDRTKAALDHALTNTSTGSAVFDRRGRVIGGSDGSFGQPDDPGGRSDTVTAQVSSDGRTVSVVYALENRDPLARDIGGDNGEEKPPSPDRTLSSRSRDDVVIDVLVATFDYLPATSSGPATARASANLVRTTSRGTTRGAHFGS